MRSHCDQRSKKEGQLGAEKKLSVFLVCSQCKGVPVGGSINEGGDRAWTTPWILTTELVSEVGG